jgi:hypothetical protein
VTCDEELVLNPTEVPYSVSSRSATLPVTRDHMASNDWMLKSLIVTDYEGSGKVKEKVKLSLLTGRGGP